MSERDAEPQPHNQPTQAGEAHAGGEGHEGHGDEHVRQMDDNPDVRAIFLVGIVGIVVTVVSIYISWGFQLHQEGQIAAAPVPATVPGTYEVAGDAGILERTELPDRPGEVPDFEAQILKRNGEAQLSTYGWTDRTRGLIRVPIKQGMDQVIQAYSGHK